MSEPDWDAIASAIARALLGGFPPDRKKIEPPDDLIARIRSDDRRLDR